MSEVVGGSAFDEPRELVDPEGGVKGDKGVNVVRHNLDLEEVCFFFLTDPCNYLFQPNIYWPRISINNRVA